jgi:hypothetical protein
MFQFIDKLGEWNPQFMREIKGRLKLFPVLVTAGISGLVQVILYLFQIREYPDAKYAIPSQYCSLGKTYQEQINILDNVAKKFNDQVYFFSSKANFDAEKLNLAKGQFKEARDRQTELNKLLYDGKSFCPPNQIDMQSWWRDHWQYLFLSLSVIFILTLLIAGTYLLINNLAQEERTGTLNFIRLSPQSETSILTGKMLGVPILIYWFVALAIPLHIWSGKAANIAFSHILSYYAVLAGSCIFFFSAALLFGLVTRFLGGFQPWLAAGAVFIFLSFKYSMGYSSSNLNNAAAWFKIFSPIEMTSYLFPNLLGSNSSWRGNYDNFGTKYLQFFFLPIGTNLLGLIGLHLAYYAVWTYGIWKGLERSFRNPNAAVISKVQSYWLVGFVQLLLWGFTLQNYRSQYPYPSNSEALSKSGYFDINSQIIQNLPWFIIFNLALLFGLMLILSPERQTIQDWSRYRHQGGSGRKGWWRNSLLRDLLIGEKSPSLVAIAVHLVTIVTPIAIWVMLSPSLNNYRSTSINWLINDVGRLRALIGIVMFVTLSLIYATIAQRMLLMKTKKRYFWAMGTVSAVMYLPLMVLGMLGVNPKQYALPWLLSSLPWVGLADASLPTIFMALLGEIAILVFLNIHLTREINLVGESATKASWQGVRE